MEAAAGNFIDLHMHLDGAVTVPVARRLLALSENRRDYSDRELEKLLTVDPGCRDLNEFLKCFDFPLTLMQTEEALSECAFLVMEEAKKNGVIYMEVRFAPQYHCKKGLSQEQAVSAVLSGMKRSSLKGNLILCAMRGEENEKENEETLRLAEKQLVSDGGIVALDLAGAEALYPTENYRDLFGKAKSLGVPFTVHAGEAAGPESVFSAVSFGARRIGHGLRSRESRKVMDLIGEKGICLEMCPTSNLATCAVEKIGDWPIREYLKEGIPVAVATDDPAIENVTLKSEFALLESGLNLTPGEERKILENSIGAAFTTEKEKEKLKARLGLL